MDGNPSVCCLWFVVPRLDFRNQTQNVFRLSDDPKAGYFGCRGCRTEPRTTFPMRAAARRDSDNLDACRQGSHRFIFYPYCFLSCLIYIDTYDSCCNQWQVYSRVRYQLVISVSQREVKIIMAVHSVDNNLIIPPAFAGSTEADRRRMVADLKGTTATSTYALHHGNSQH